mgnify:FL=1
MGPSVTDRISGATLGIVAAIDARASGRTRRGRAWAYSQHPPRLKTRRSVDRQEDRADSCVNTSHLKILARGVIGNTPGFDPGIPSSSLGGPVLYTKMNKDTNIQTPIAAVILAAGKGTRMDSDLPKVLHPVAHKPMVQWVVDAVTAAGVERTILVVGHGAEEVKSKIPHCEFVLQEPQLGTGHAVDVCRHLLRDFEGDILVLGGDGPLIRSETITEMIDKQKETSASATLATSTIPDPTGYGRIIRDENDRFLAIVEHKNATPEQLEIHEVYPSYAIFNAASLWSCLENLEKNPVSNEYYLTEIPAMMLARGEKVEIVNAVPPEDILSINTPEQLAEVEAMLQTRLDATVESTS